MRLFSDEVERKELYNIIHMSLAILGVSVFVWGMIAVAVDKSWGVKLIAAGALLFIIFGLLWRGR